ncbi:MAG: hypothetical protein QM736_24140 [Vicinamibacterales bacterium]
MHSEAVLDEPERHDRARPPQSSPPPSTSDTRALAAIVLLGVYVVVLLRTAWLGDDAFITLRTVDNFVNGYGMRWNVAERVQSFTHPLWFFVLAVPYSVTREPYFTVYALTFATSIATFWLALKRVASGTTAACVAGAALVCSKAFVDYSTSGLENPLSHLLVVLLLLSFWQVQRDGKHLTRLWTLGSLLALTRLDLSLIAAPVLVAGSLRFTWRDVVKPAAAGLLPVVAWELFSVVYYGVPFPNTAYAKLQTGISAASLAGQGLLYLVDAVSTDPVTPLAIAVGSAIVWRIGAREDRAVLLGVLLYVAYVVRVGGDFMTGRFLTVPVIAVVATWARRARTLPVSAAGAAAAALVTFGLFATTRPPLTSGLDTFIMNAVEGLSPSGVADERAFYYRYTGLLRWSRERPLPWNAQVERGLALRAAPTVLTETNVGFIGYYAGPGSTIIDEYGLCDPLLARLPVEGEWRIGHFYRPAPPGYADSIREDRNRIVDPALARRYELIRRLTRDPLWSRRRWRAILAVNLGR